MTCVPVPCPVRSSRCCCLGLLNRHLVPDFAKVERELAALKARHDANAKAAVAVQQAREGSTVTLN